jgi:hypothetical protein
MTTPRPPLSQHDCDSFFYQLEDVVIELNYLAGKMLFAHYLNDQSHAQLRSLTDAITALNKHGRRSHFELIDIASSNL